MKYITKKNINELKNVYYLPDVVNSLLHQEDIKSKISYQGFKIDETDYSSEIYDIRKNLKLFDYGAYYQATSPACINCRNKAINFYTQPVTLKCNKSCFFCVVDLGSDLDLPLDDIDNEFNKKNGIDYFAVSGGEPLLDVEKTKQILTRINSLNPSVHTRIYTNGDLWNDEINNTFLSLSLNEVRLSIKQEELDDLEYIKNKINKINDIDIIIEMPVFPQHYDKMIKLFDVMVDCSIKGINLLEMGCHIYKNKSKDFNNHNLAIAYSPNDFYDSEDYMLPIAKSSLVCYRLLEYIQDNKFPFFAHHCTTMNSKTMFHNYHYNKINKQFYHISDSTSYLIKACIVGKDAIDAEKIFEQNNISHLKSDKPYPFITFNPKDIKYINSDEILLKFYSLSNNQFINVKTATINSNDYGWL